MPKVDNIVIRWDEESDNQLLNIERNYRKPCAMHKLGNKFVTYLVDWKRAESEGAFKGLPEMDRKGYIKRLIYLRQKIADSEGFLQKRNEHNRKRIKKYEQKHGHKIKNNSVRYKVFRSLPEEIKLQYGWKPKRIWNELQQNLLLEIVTDYKNISIDWINLMYDKRVLKLPEKYHNDLHALRKYYHSLIFKIRGGEELKAKKREIALKYKAKNYKRHMEQQLERNQIIRDTVNVYLYSKMPRKQ